MRRPWPILIASGVVWARSVAEAVDVLRGLAGLVAGGNRPDLHLRGVEPGRDLGEKRFEAKVLLLTPKEVEYFRHGGILHYVLRNLAHAA